MLMIVPLQCTFPQTSQWAGDSPLPPSVVSIGLPVISSHANCKSRHCHCNQHLLSSFFSSVLPRSDRQTYGQTTGTLKTLPAQLSSAWLPPHTITEHAVSTRRNIHSTNEHQLLATNCNLPCIMLH